MEIYVAYFNDNVHEYGGSPISFNQTEQGARDALARFIRKDRKSHQDLYLEHIPMLKDWPRRYWEGREWEIEKVEVDE